MTLISGNSNGRNGNQPRVQVRFEKEIFNKIINSKAPFKRKVINSIFLNYFRRGCIEYIKKNVDNSSNLISLF